MLSVAMNKRNVQLPQHSSGVALIEVLVAVLLFALGVLALVGLQGALTRAQTDAKIRTDAAALANEVIGQMWADIGQINSYDDASCAGHARCKSWQDKVAQTLPSGKTSITVDNSNRDVEVTIMWSTPSGDTHKYETHTTIATAN